MVDGLEPPPVICILHCSNIPHSSPHISAFPNKCVLLRVRRPSTFHTHRLKVCTKQEKDQGGSQFLISEKKAEPEPWNSEALKRATKPKKAKKDGRWQKDEDI